MLKINMIAPIRYMKYAAVKSDFFVVFSEMLKNIDYRNNVISIYNDIYKKDSNKFMIDNSNINDLDININCIKDLKGDINILSTRNTFEKALKTNSNIDLEYVGKYIDGNILKYDDRYNTYMFLPKTSEEFIAVINLVKELKIDNFKIGINWRDVMKALRKRKYNASLRIIFLNSSLKCNSSFKEYITQTYKLHFIGLNSHPLVELRSLASNYNATIESTLFLWPFISQEKDFLKIESRDSIHPFDFNYVNNSNFFLAKFQNYLNYLQDNLIKNKIIESA